jgi:hypothetical protein
MIAEFAAVQALHLALAIAMAIFQTQAMTAMAFA